MFAPPRRCPSAKMAPTSPFAPRTAQNTHCTLQHKMYGRARTRGLLENVTRDGLSSLVHRSVIRRSLVRLALPLLLSLLLSTLSILVSFIMGKYSAAAARNHDPLTLTPSLPHHIIVVIVCAQAGSEMTAAPSGRPRRAQGGQGSNLASTFPLARRVQIMGTDRKSNYAKLIISSVGTTKVS